MQIFNARETADLLPYDDMILALENAYRGEVVTPERVHHKITSEENADKTLILMPAWRADAPIGVKLVNVVPDNGARGLPSISGIYMLFDGDTGAPVALLDGPTLTARRTAAVAALAAKYLARAEARTHLIMGAGAIAPHLAHTHRAVRSIDTTLIWARRPAEAERLAASLRDKVPGVEAVTDLPAAAARADIISCATLASDPILKGQWLSRGVHVDLMGSYLPHMREADDATLRGATIHVDQMPGALQDSGELRLPLEAGVISRSDIIGDLESLCLGLTPSRQSDAEKTLFKSVGSARSDYAVAAAAFEHIRAA
ncbi:ornithine cyclodeaminase family protein [Sphingopyxis sp. MWB1]|uniref:ornithine cyclodeaminase family protein n=1 Tax=Sphingopyxis sp. MWB1 TaxID=1537715 RepID=UPI00068A15C8|nr:ornithine cyclodeaminase family protein [Sphingopyxis sp. MWB1]